MKYLSLQITTHTIDMVYCICKIKSHSNIILWTLCNYSTLFLLLVNFLCPVLVCKVLPRRNANSPSEKHSSLTKIHLHNIHIPTHTQVTINQLQMITWCVILQTLIENWYRYWRRFMFYSFVTEMRWAIIVGPCECPVA